MQTVAQQLDLPAAAVRTVLAGQQRPEVDVFGDRLYVAVNAPRQDPSGQSALPSELDLFVGRSYLVSVHEHPMSVTEHVLVRAAQHPTPLKLEPVLLLSVLMDELLTHYEELTEDLEDDIEAMEERALTDASDAFLADLLALKRYVFAVYRLAGQHRAVVTAFLRPDFPLVGGGEVEPYFRDLDDRMGRLLNSLEAAKEAVNGAFDLFVSQVSRRTNDIMKVLAIVSTVLLPSTVILGFFGTSFQTPPIATNATFTVMIAAIVVVTGLILLIFHRWGWLRGSPSMPATAAPAVQAPRGGLNRDMPSADVAASCAICDDGGMPRPAAGGRP